MNKLEELQETKEIPDVLENEKLDEITFTPVKKDNSNHRVIAGLSFLGVFIVLIFLAVFSTIFAILNINNDKIISGIYIKNINVSNLTKEDAIKLVENTINPKITENIVVKYNDYEITILPEQLEGSFDINSAVEIAYRVGREDNILKNNYSILATLFNNINIEPTFTYNSDALNQIVSDIADKIPGKTTEPAYYIEDSNLIITPGKDGVVVNQDILKNLFIENITNLSYSAIEIPVYEKQCEKINIDSIYSEVKKAPQDAYYTQNPFVIHPHVNGIDFNISLDEAKQLIEQTQEEYTIPLKIVAPDKTTNQIGTEAFPDLLAEFSTKYAASNVNRTTNLRLATNKITGTVLLPGETFSYNKVVGKRTIAAGFKDAAIFQNGKVVDGLGGGICQISSTLYNAVLLSNLEIVDRSNHGFVTSYLGAGRDATVVYGSIDFKFKNNRQYPIKITGTVSGRCCYI